MIEYVDKKQIVYYKTELIQTLLSSEPGFIGLIRLP